MHHTILCPDEAVGKLFVSSIEFLAYGAAVQADGLSVKENIGDLVLLNVNPLTMRY